MRFEIQENKTLLFIGSWEEGKKFLHVLRNIPLNTCGDASKTICSLASKLSENVVGDYGFLYTDLKIALKGIRNFECIGELFTDIIPTHVRTLDKVKSSTHNFKHPLKPVLDIHVDGKIIDIKMFVKSKLV